MDCASSVAYSDATGMTYGTASYANRGPAGMPTPRVPGVPPGGTSSLSLAWDANSSRGGGGGGGLTRARSDFGGGRSARGDRAFGQQGAEPVPTTRVTAPPGGASSMSLAWEDERRPMTSRREHTGRSLPPGSSVPGSAAMPPSDYGSSYAYGRGAPPAPSARRPESSAADMPPHTGRRPESSAAAERLRGHLQARRPSESAAGEPPRRGPAGCTPPPQRRASVRATPVPSEGGSRASRPQIAGRASAVGRPQQRSEASAPVGSRRGGGPASRGLPSDVDEGSRPRVFRPSTRIQAPPGGSASLAPGGGWGPGAGGGGGGGASAAGRGPSCGGGGGPECHAGGGAAGGRNRRVVEQTRFFQDPGQRVGKQVVQHDPSADWRNNESHRYYLDNERLGKAVRQSAGGGERTAPGSTAGPPPASAPLLCKGAGALASQQSTCANSVIDYCPSAAGAPSECDSLPLGIEWSTYIPPVHLCK